jgi:histone H3/H4
MRYFTPSYFEFKSHHKTKQKYSIFAMNFSESEETYYEEEDTILEQIKETVDDLNQVEDEGPIDEEIVDDDENNQNDDENIPEMEENDGNDENEENEENNENNENDISGNIGAENEEASPPKKPRLVIKKPPSKWVLFLTMNRKRVSEENPQLSFTEIIKYLAEQYKQLSPDDSLNLDKLIEEKKSEYLTAIAAQMEEDGEDSNFMDNLHPNKKGKENEDEIFSFTKLQIPLARTKKIMKLDPDCKIISKDAIAIMTKATELFIARLAVKASSTTSLRGARTIHLQDLLHTIHSSSSSSSSSSTSSNMTMMNAFGGYTSGISPFAFLTFDFPKPSNGNSSNQILKTGKSLQRNNNNNNNNLEKVAVVSSGKASIMNYMVSGKQDQLQSSYSSVSYARKRSQAEITEETNDPIEEVDEEVDEDGFAVGEANGQEDEENALIRDDHNEEEEEGGEVETVRKVSKSSMSLSSFYPPATTTATTVQVPSSSPLSESPQESQSKSTEHKTFPPTSSLYDW